MRSHRHGVTLIEMLAVIAIVAILGAVVGGLALQAARVHARTSPHIEPQASQMRALQRMERDIREAMLINTAPSTANWVEVVLPEQDADGNNVIVENPVTHHLGLRQGETIRYFLGTKVAQDTAHNGRWLALPSAQGTAVFRVGEASVQTSEMYDNAELIIDGILSQPLVPSPSNPSVMVPTNLFTYWPTNDNGTPDNLADDTPTVNTRLVKITLTIPVQDGASAATPHTLWTQFCLRNLQTSQATR